MAVLGEWPPDDLPENLPWGIFAYVHVLDVVKAWFWLCNNWGHLCKLGADPAHLLLPRPSPASAEERF